MNNFKLSTGNEMVDNVSEINFTGNIIPSMWYKTITRDNGKPYLTAIVILADIVYWYRWSEVRDTVSGGLLGVKKKFKEDTLQRSYQQLADMFGISKREATAATTFLERLGVIKRDYRKIKSRGMTFNNVVYISINHEVLKILTYGLTEDISKDVKDTCGLSHNDKLTSNQIDEEVVQKNVILSTPKCNRVLPENVIGHTFANETNTKNITKITNRDFNHITSYKRDEIDKIFKKTIEFEILINNTHNTIGLIDDLVTTAVDVLVSDSPTIRVNQQNVSTQDVKDRLWSLNMTHIQYAHDCLVGLNTKQKNIRNYLITTLYNAPATINNYYTNLVNYNTNKELSTKEE